MKAPELYISDLLNIQHCINFYIRHIEETINVSCKKQKRSIFLLRFRCAPWHYRYKAFASSLRFITKMQDLMAQRQELILILEKLDESTGIGKNNEKITLAEMKKLRDQI